MLHSHLQVVHPLTLQDVHHDTLAAGLQGGQALDPYLMLMFDLARAENMVADTPFLLAIC